MAWQANYNYCYANCLTFLLLKYGQGQGHTHKFTNPQIMTSNFYSLRLKLSYLASHNSKFTFTLNLQALVKLNCCCSNVCMAAWADAKKGLLIA